MAFFCVTEWPNLFQFEAIVEAALSSLDRSSSAMPFGKGCNTAPNSKRKYRNTWPLSSVSAPWWRSQPVTPENFQGLLESDSDVEEILDNITDVPKASERQRIIIIAYYYTNVLGNPQKREWKGHGSTILIIREELRFTGGGLENHP